jgi:hypothetical protein
MVTAGDDDEGGRGHFVDETVLIADAAGPLAGEVSLQRFRFANTVKGGPQYILDQHVDAAQQTAVVSLKP